MELGGNITLVGFDEKNFAELIVVKKLVGQYARRLNDNVSGFERLTLTHEGASNASQIHAKCDIRGKPYTSEVSGNNLFIALDQALKNVVSQVS